MMIILILILIILIIYNYSITPGRSFIANRYYLLIILEYLKTISYRILDEKFHSCFCKL